MSIIISGPKPQFTPSISTPNASKTVATVSGSEPVKVLISVLNVKVQIIGTSPASLTAIIAALASCISEIVSILIILTPDSINTLACS